jgi:hypothetical protein
MRDTPTDNSPRMASNRYSGEGASDSFDSILPPEVRDELLQRRRPVANPPRPTPPRATPPWWQSILTFIGMISMPILAVAILGGFLWSVQIVGRNAAPSASGPAPLAVPTPAPVVRRSPIVEVRRAEPVPVTVKRAEAVRFPLVHIEPLAPASTVTMPLQASGDYQWYALPEAYGGGSVYARFMGTVGRFSDIPKNAQLGDMWHVVEGGATWILTQSPRYGAAAVWIDPPL